MDTVRLVLSTFPNSDTARQIGTLALKNQAIACVNLIPNIESIYRWQGNIESASEVLAIFKTTAPAAENFSKWLAAMHPYDTPEVVVIAPEFVEPGYGKWLVQCVPTPSSEKIL